MGSIGTNNNIHPTAILYPGVIIGNNNYIGAYAVIGSPPEHKKYPKSQHSVIIGNGNWIGDHVTISQGCQHDTFIGDDNFICKGAYIAHDCYLYDGITISANASFGGCCLILDKVNIGMGATIHQGSTINSGTMIGMGCVVPKMKIEPNSIYVGNPAKYLKPNKKLYEQNKD